MHLQALASSIKSDFYKFYNFTPEVSDFKKAKFFWESIC